MIYYNIIDNGHGFASSFCEAVQWGYVSEAEALKALQEELPTAADFDRYYYTLKVDDKWTDVINLKDELEEFHDGKWRADFEENPKNFFVDDRGDLVKG